MALDIHHTVVTMLTITATAAYSVYHMHTRCLSSSSSVSNTSYICTTFTILILRNFLISYSGIIHYALRLIRFLYYSSNYIFQHILSVPIYSYNTHADFLPCLRSIMKSSKSVPVKYIANYIYSYSYNI